MTGLCSTPHSRCSGCCCRRVCRQVCLWAHASSPLMCWCACGNGDGWRTVRPFCSCLVSSASFLSPVSLCCHCTPFLSLWGTLSLVCLSPSLFLRSMVAVCPTAGSFTVYVGVGRLLVLGGRFASLSLFDCLGTLLLSLPLSMAVGTTRACHRP